MEGRRDEGTEERIGEVREERTKGGWGRETHRQVSAGTSERQRTVEIGKKDGRTDRRRHTESQNKETNRETGMTVHVTNVAERWWGAAEAGVASLVIRRCTNARR